ncbi:MAG: hypothetical protein U5Q03_00155 [Bacteroidota bacterium]|nr:hypothetical protein [Bacteroidota bacterium]
MKKKLALIERIGSKRMDDLENRDVLFIKNGNTHPRVAELDQRINSMANKSIFN